ncbi:hypothetical protein AB0J82_35165 [Asanoa sp. NPDC049518]|uniref:hypothetical protein n=1 Tax=unclassified Asanoa TaxID=2685164 RepID=UPI00341BAE96
MTTRLEEELADAMRSLTEGLRPTDGLVARALRRHRRRRMRSVAAAGTFVALAVVAVAAVQPMYARLGTTPDEPTMLTVAAIVERAAAALPPDQIQHSLTTDTRDGYSRECWRDPITGDSRCRDLPSRPGAGDTEYWLRVRPDPSGGKVWSYTMVDHAARTWTTRDARFPDGGSSRELEDPRSLFERDELYMEGEESIDGNDTFMLGRQIVDPTGIFVTEHIWVETDSFRLVRSLIFDSEYRSQTDYKWLSRDNESLELLNPVVPAGYSRR